MKIMRLKWTDEQNANSEIPYNHVIAPSPLGCFVITWKGWKESPCYDVELQPKGFLTSDMDLNGAKDQAQMQFEDIVKRCLNS